MNTKPKLRPEFWRRFPLDELNNEEWEALCDGCGECCLEKFLDNPDLPYTVEYTDVACKLLDCDTGCCSNYDNRQDYVPECVSLTPEKLKDMMWLPNTCAYKRLFLGQSLPDWHYLITNDRATTIKGMKRAGVGVAGRCISETEISEEAIENRIIRWVEA